MGLQGRFGWSAHPLGGAVLQILWGTLLLHLKSGSWFVTVLCLLVCNLPQLLTYSVIFSLIVSLYSVAQEMEETFVQVQALW